MAATPSDSHGAASGGATPIHSRDRTYLIAKNDAIAPAGLDPLDFGWLVEQLRADPEVTQLRTVEPRSLTLQQSGPSIVQSVVVATMPAATAAALEQHPQVVLEEDHLLLPQPATAQSAHAVADPSLLSPFGSSTEWRITLTSAGGDAIAGATVYLYGQGIPAQGRTDDAGVVTLALTNETDQTIRALYVNPLRDYWSLWVDRPALVSGGANVVQLTSLSDMFDGFPAQQMLGWGQLAMRLDQVPPELDGRAIRVAVIDSGAAASTHADLGSVRNGADFTVVPPGTDTWRDDTIAHGSHCTGIIAGSSGLGGVRGFAPAAEVYEARIFPGGRVSSLLDAVDYCIDQQIDVVNMSLGTGGTSQILLEKLAQAKAQGVACIVAAGNSGDKVQFPGSSPDVLTVAAIGHDDEFPANSYHAQQRWTAGSTDGGFFAAQFSCHGPEVDVCGPGVAIVSSVPPNGFAAWDGTSMATPHIAGLAALVLAHHPDFNVPALQMRTAARVNRLFAILQEAATPLQLGDELRTGKGLPDAVRALALDRPGQPVADVASQTTAVREALALVRLDLVAAGLLGDVTPSSVQPSSLAPPWAQPNLEPNEIRRLLAATKAQMYAAGLRVDDAVPSPTP